jgi:cell division septum initiation protein DivIVA
VNDPRKDLEQAVAELKRRLGAKEVPDRHLVRMALIALGRITIDEGEEAARAPAHDLASAAEAHAERWEEAFQSEMALAVAEHVHSVDPRYLEMPGYDFAYTIAARERLEARLRAADLLQLAVPEALLDQVATADERLAPHLEGEA